MTIPNDFLHCVFVTAIEGGINYWARIDTYVWSKPGDGPDSFEGRVEDTENFHAEIYDAEDDRAYRVNIETIRNGINAILAGTATFGGRAPHTNAAYVRTLRQAVAENEAGFVDADVADTVIQAALFDDIRYG